MLQHRILKGIGWSALGTWSRGLVSVISLIILARFLTPEDYGAYALAFMVVAGASLLISGPMAEAITQEPELDPQLCHDTFWTGTVVGLLLAGGLTLLGPGIARVFSLPILANILPVFSVYGVIVALGAVPIALMTRDLRFKALNQINVISAIGGAVAGVIAAWQGAGAWSLVAMEGVNAILRNGLALVAAHYTPGRPSKGLGALSVAVRNRGSAGVWSLHYIAEQTPRAVIGFFLGAAPLGLFVFAARFFDRIAGLLLAPIGSVALAAVSRTQTDRAQLHSLLGNGLRLTSFVCAPAFLGLAAIAPALMPALFGERWIPAVLPAQLLLLIGIRAAMGAFNISILRGIGQHGAPVLVTLFEAVGLIIGLLLVVHKGIVAACIAILVVQLAAAPLSAWFVARATGFTMRDQVSAAGPLLASAAIMAISVMILRRALENVMPVWSVIGLCLVTGLATYAIAVWLITPGKERRDAIGKIKQFLIKGEGSDHYV